MTYEEFKKKEDAKWEAQRKELKKRGEELDQLESKFEKEMKELESGYDWN